jgi:tRNA(Ile)-lysidine synthase
MEKSDILDRVARRFRGVAEPGASVLTAVSGGADSTALLFLLHALRKKCTIRRLAVLHVNHGLRGCESDGDEAYVASLARRLRSPFFCRTLSGRTLRSAGMESWARRERYVFFRETMRSQRYDCVATGHTADDQAETVLFRILRGAGLRGLRGILPKRDDGVIRPILDVRREEIAGWLASEGIPFRHDSSNDDRNFQRNSIRLEVLPAMERREPAARQLLCGIAETSQEIWNSAQPRIGQWIMSFVKRSADCFAVSREGLADGFHASEGLRMLFDHYGIPTDTPHIEALMENLSSRSREYLLPGGAWRYFTRRDSLLFSRGPLAGPSRFSYALAVPGATSCPACGTRFIVTEGRDRPGKIPDDRHNVVLDAEACGRKLIYRSWRPDDTFVPFGGRRKTKVGQFLAKQRLARHERNTMGVVEGTAGAVVWIPGVRLSELVRVTSRTRRVIMISYQSSPAEA